MSDWAHIAERALQLVFPPRCLFCDEILPIGAACEDCAQVTDSLKLTGDDRSTADDDRDLDNLEGVVSSFSYQGAVKEAVARYKFRGEPALFRPMSQFMAHDIAFVADRIDTVTFVPSYHSSDEHARWLAKGVANGIGKPFGQLIHKTRKTQKQHDLTREQRKHNLKGAFRAANAEINGAIVLICDDVVTSGNTLNECAAALKRAGAKSVYACTFSATGKLSQ